ncbi:hypothetical protein [Cetobacterium sp.]|uniref:hypothetical protein n=1 Tax=Cetobacterium sp. TaxID=2071632 RepID=UPI003AEF8916
MIKKISILLSFLLLFLQGCSALNSRVIAVDSYSTQQAYGGTYYLSTNTPGLQLQQQSFEIILQNMLQTKGYTRTFNQKDALYNIVYGYKVKGPYTSLESYPAPINPWWNGPYGGIYNGFYGDMWMNSISATTYFVKRLELSAYTKNNNAVWQVVGSLKSDNSDPRSSFPYLVSAISNYVNVNSNKVVYLNVEENSKTGQYTATPSMW